MPYGLAKAIGGDTPGNDQKMERCIAQVMAKGNSKLSAVQICKAAIQKGGKR